MRVKGCSSPAAGFICDFYISCVCVCAHVLMCMHANLCVCVCVTVRMRDKLLSLTRLVNADIIIITWVPIIFYKIIWIVKALISTLNIHGPFPFTPLLTDERSLVFVHLRTAFTVDTVHWASGGKLFLPAHVLPTLSASFVARAECWGNHLLTKCRWCGLPHPAMSHWLAGWTPRVMNMFLSHCDY